jgi:hypothetical protein
LFLRDHTHSDTNAVKRPISVGTLEINVCPYIVSDVSAVSWPSAAPLMVALGVAMSGMYLLANRNIEHIL